MAGRRAGRYECRGVALGWAWNKFRWRAKQRGRLSAQREPPPLQQSVQHTLFISASCANLKNLARVRYRKPVACPVSRPAERQAEEAGRAAATFDRKSQQLLTCCFDQHDTALDSHGRTSATSCRRHPAAVGPRMRSRYRHFRVGNRAQRKAQGRAAPPPAARATRGSSFGPAYRQIHVPISFKLRYRKCGWMSCRQQVAVGA